MILGVCAKKINLAGEINLYTRKFRMPEKPFIFSLKYLSPAALTCLTLWGFYHLFVVEGGIYGGYPLWAQLVFGWAVSISVFASGFLILGISEVKKKRIPKLRKIKPRAR